MLATLALQASAGQPVSPVRWIAGAAMGPLSIVVVKGALRLSVVGDRFAEIRGGRVRLGTIGYTFDPSHLVSCEIMQDGHFPEVSHLCFCFRLFRWGRPRYWTMMVEDVGETERFRGELARLAAQR